MHNNETLCTYKINFDTDEAEMFLYDGSSEDYFICHNRKENKISSRYNGRFQSNKFMFDRAKEAVIAASQVEREAERWNNKPHDTMQKSQ